MNNTDKNSSEEVDLGQLFRAIISLFRQLFSGVSNFLLKIYSLFIHALKLVIEYYKVVIPVILISFLIGLFKETKSNPQYSSKMLVKTFFDSKYQLIDNLNYYNTLIENNNLEELEKIFKIDTNELASLISFKIEAGLETRNDLLKYYDKYVKEIDTSMTELITFDEFIKNRELVSGNLFDISVVSEKRDIFKKLEPGLKKSFANEYSVKIKQKRDSIIQVKKESIEEQIIDINRLKKTYVEVLELESKNPNLNLSYGQLPLTEQVSKTKEFELLNKELELKNSLRMLNEQKINTDEYYEILSSFQEVGSKHQTLTTNFKIIYPIYSLIALFLIFGIWKFVIYVKNYE